MERGRGIKVCLGRGRGREGKTHLGKGGMELWQDVPGEGSCEGGQGLPGEGEQDPGDTQVSQAPSSPRMGHGAGHGLEPIPSLPLFTEGP